MTAYIANKMTNPLPDSDNLTLSQAAERSPTTRHSFVRSVQFALIVVVLIVYSYPSLRTTAGLGATPLPPIVAPDLSLYLNLSNVRSVSSGEVLNPYYLLAVPAKSTAYLKFRLGAALFAVWNELFPGRTWLALFVWNIFWWSLLCGVALWLFRRFLPTDSWEIGVAGLGLLMLINTGMARAVFTAWIHLPSLTGFQNVALPFMRPFAPQIPIPLLLGYLALQMMALQKKSVFPWVGMGVIQLLALSTFPYATLMMAGLTFVSVAEKAFPAAGRHAYQPPLIYGGACAIVDGAFLMRGSMNIYASHASPIHFQLHLLPHLIGGTWLLIFLLTLTTALSKNLPAEVKWPLIGLGATNALIMLGDAVVPSTVLLLSAHASYFAHTTAVVLITFLFSSLLFRMHCDAGKVRVGAAIVFSLLALNGMLQSLGTYRAFLPLNLQQLQVTRLLGSWQAEAGDLFIARSRNADDACGWIALLAKGPVLFCTDAETMLTPLQNQQIQSFREALYLYLSGKDSGYLRRMIDDPNPAAMYQLGFWAEATSFSREEQDEGRRSIRSQLLPAMERVEKHDSAASDFFRQFHRVVVIDDLRDPTFADARLASFLKLDREQHFGSWVLLSYVPQ